MLEPITRPSGWKPGLAHEQELVDREVAREQAGAVLLQPRAAGLGDALGALRVIGHGGVGPFGWVERARRPAEAARSGAARASGVPSESAVVGGAAARRERGILADGGADDVQRDDQVLALHAAELLDVVAANVLADLDADDAVGAERARLPADAGHRLAARGVDALRVVARAPGCATSCRRSRCTAPASSAWSPGRSGRSWRRRSRPGGSPPRTAARTPGRSRSVSTGPPGARSAGGQPHGGADGDELDRAGGPVVAALLDAHADDGVGARGLRLLEQPPEREPAALVVGVRDASSNSVGAL